MTRSELLQIGITLSMAGMQEPIESNRFYGNADEDIRALNALSLELFLAEQKRSDAIKQLERRADAVSSIGEFEEYNALTTALTVLRAELARQDAKPLTCDGCMHESEKLEPMCYFCTRIRSDRYDPKGEKA